MKQSYVKEYIRMKIIKFWIYKQLHGKEIAFDKFSLKDNK